jgi:hypothetical protein
MPRHGRRAVVRERETQIGGAPETARSNRVDHGGILVGRLRGAIMSKKQRVTRSASVLFAALSAFVLMGCGSDDDNPPPVETTDTGTAPVDTATATEDTAPADAPADDVAADAAVPATPEIVSVMPMAGAWHVTWQLNDTALTKVELWRTDDGAAATRVTSLAGYAKDFHDGAATGTVVTYCWTVKTFRGELASEMSAEKCSK